MPCMCRNPAAKEISNRQAEIGQNRIWITAPDGELGYGEF